MKESGCSFIESTISLMARKDGGKIPKEFMEGTGLYTEI